MQETQKVVLLDIIFLKPMKKGVKQYWDVRQFKLLVFQSAPDASWNASGQHPVNDGCFCWWRRKCLSVLSSLVSALTVRRDLVLPCGKGEASIRCGARWSHAWLRLPKVDGGVRAGKDNLEKWICGCLCWAMETAASCTGTGENCPAVSPLGECWNKTGGYELSFSWWCFLSVPMSGILHTPFVEHFQI